ncbi:MAG TPA: GIY-YIG nuclease family protein [Candidatus Hypogeohydataceae bacterium YC41]
MKPVQQQPSITISFFDKYDFNETNIALVQGYTGLYFMYLNDLHIPYPFLKSRLIYIGMSESKQNSIGNRLRDHRSGQSGNFAIANYTKTYQAKFTYLSFEILKHLGTDNVMELESFFLRDFLQVHGACPICNNQVGTAFPESNLFKKNINIQWDFFV